MNDNRPDPAVLKLDSDPGFAATMDSNRGFGKQLDYAHGFVAISTSDYATSGKAPALPLVWSKDLVHWEQVKHQGLKKYDQHHSYKKITILNQ